MADFLSDQYRRQRKMHDVDNQPAEIRAVVHVAGWDFVRQMLDLGVRKAPRMWHILEVARGIACGDAGTRDRPNEAEIAAVAETLAAAYGHPGRVTEQDVIAARAMTNALWDKLRWGRCLCMGTLPIAWRQPRPEATHNG